MYLEKIFKKSERDVIQVGRSAEQILKSDAINHVMADLTEIYVNKAVTNREDAEYYRMKLETLNDIKGMFLRYQQEKNVAERKLKK